MSTHSTAVLTLMLLDPISPVCTAALFLANLFIRPDHCKAWKILERGAFELHACSKRVLEISSTCCENTLDHKVHVH